MSVYLNLILLIILTNELPGYALAEDRINCSEPIVYEDLSWSYRSDCTGPSNWHKIEPQYCSLTRQSPINLVHSETRYDPHLTSPVISRVSNNSRINTNNFGKYKIENTGHGVQIDFPEKEWQLTYEGSNQVYYVAQFHWHWGNASTNIGSEHAINSKFYDMEAHFVTYSSLYPEGYKSSKSVLAIFGILYEVAESASDRIMDKITETFSNENITIESSTEAFVEIDGFDLRELFPSTTARFFRYDGSLTTPPCFQNAIWTVFEIPKKISKANLNKFRTLLKYPDGKPLADNIRPLQPLNVQGGPYAQRIITASFKVPLNEGFRRIGVGKLANFIASILIALHINIMI